MGISLTLLGWKEFDTDTYLKLEKCKRCVLVFPHTTYADYALYLAYLMRYNMLQARCRVFINPRFMKRWGWFVKMFGGREATKREIHGGGGVKKICDELKEMDEFILAMSPKGSTENHPWRSGYYNVAKELNCPVVPGGFDYKKKKFIIKDPVEIGDKTKEEIDQICQRALYDVTPQNIKNSEFPIQAEGESNPSFLPTFNLVLIILIIIVIIIIIIFLIYYLIGTCSNRKRTKEWICDGTNSAIDYCKDNIHFY